MFFKKKKKLTKALTAKKKSKEEGNLQFLFHYSAAEAYALNALASHYGMSKAAVIKTLIDVAFNDLTGTDDE
jgi:hypothetical protein